MANDDRKECALARLKLPKRALNALRRGGILTLEDAAEWSDRDLLSLPHIGPVSVASLRALIGRAAKANDRIRLTSQPAIRGPHEHAGPP
ncbi:MAG: DNA-directed RNA polymerase subunit alpha C-terminal domain-containing protein [Rhizomicrobium sp.]